MQGARAIGRRHPRYGDIEHWLNKGLQRVILGTVAENPALVREAARAFACGRGLMRAMCCNQRMGRRNKCDGHRFGQIV